MLRLEGDRSIAEQLMQIEAAIDVGLLTTRSSGQRFARR
jgi:hypothetical protein